MKVSCVRVSLIHIQFYLFHSYSVLFVPLLQEVFVLTRPDKSMPAKWRREAAESGCHSYISIAVPQTLDPEVANELRGLDIDELRLVDLQDFARIVGVSPSGRKAELKLRLAPLIQSINGFACTTDTHARAHTLIPPPHTHTRTHTHTQILALR